MQLEMDAPTEVGLPDTSESGAAESQEKGETTITPDILAKAIQKTSSADLSDEDALKNARAVLDFFGQADTIIDNMLEKEDRDLFYMLEDQRLLRQESEETTLYDGREWRIHHWILNIARICGVANAPEAEAALLDPETNPALAYHHQGVVDDSMWRKSPAKTASATTPLSELDMKISAMLDESESLRSAHVSDQSEVRRVLNLITGQAGVVRWEQIPGLMGGPPSVAWSAAETAIMNGFLVVTQEGDAKITTLGAVHLHELAKGPARSAVDSRADKLEDMLLAIKQADARNSLASADISLTVGRVSVLDAIRTQFFEGPSPYIEPADLAAILKTPDELSGTLSALEESALISRNTTEGGVVLDYIGLAQYARSLSLGSVAYVCLRALKQITNGSMDVAATPEEIGTKAGLRNPGMFSHLLKYLSRSGILKEKNSNGATAYSIGSAENVNDILARLEKKVPENMRGDGWLETIKQLKIFRGAVVDEGGAIIRKSAPRIRIRPAATLVEKELSWGGKKYVLVDVGFTDVASLAERIRTDSAASGITKIPLPHLLFEKAAAVAGHANRRGTDFGKIAGELNLPVNSARNVVAQLVRWGMPFSKEYFSPEEHELEKLLKEWGGEQKTVSYQKQPYMLVNVNSHKRGAHIRAQLVAEKSHGTKIPLAPSLFSRVENFIKHAHENFLYYWRLQKETELSEIRLRDLARQFVKAGIPIPTRKPTLEDLIEAKLVPWYGGEKTVRYADVKYALIDIGEYDLEERAKTIIAHVGKKKVFPVSSALFSRAEAVIKHVYGAVTDREGIAAELSISHQSVMRAINGFRAAGIPIPLEQPSAEELAKLKGVWFGPEATFNYLGNTYTFVSAGERVREELANTIREKTGGQVLPVNHNLFAALPAIFGHVVQSHVDLVGICEETNLPEASVRTIISKLNSLGVPIPTKAANLRDLAAVGMAPWLGGEKAIKYLGKIYRLIDIGAANLEERAAFVKAYQGNTRLLPVPTKTYVLADVIARHAGETVTDYERIRAELSSSNVTIVRAIRRLNELGIPIPLKKPDKNESTRLHGISFGPESTHTYLGEAYTFIDAGKHIGVSRAKEIADAVLKKTGEQKIPVNHSTFNHLPAIFECAGEDGIDLERLAQETGLSKDRLYWVIRDLNSFNVPVPRNRNSLEEMAVERETRVRFQRKTYRLVCFNQSDYNQYKESAKGRLNGNVVPLTRRLFCRAPAFIKNATQHGLDFDKLQQELDVTRTQVYNLAKKLGAAGLPIPRNASRVEASTGKAEYAPEERTFLYDGQPYNLINVGYGNTTHRAEEARTAGKLPVSGAIFKHLSVFAKHSSGNYIDLAAIMAETGLTLSGVSVAIPKINAILNTTIPTARRQHIKDAARTSWGERPYALQILTETYRAVIVGDRGRWLPARRNEAKQMGYVPVTSLEMCVLAKAAAYINRNCFDLGNVSKELDKPPSRVTKLLRSCVDAGVKSLEKYIGSAGGQEASA
jgi:biotin operon repressor